MLTCKAYANSFDFCPPLGAPLLRTWTFWGEVVEDEWASIFSSTYGIHGIRYDMILYMKK